MTRGGEVRDWEPGDGVRCSNTKASPVPCGRPVKTHVEAFDIAPGKGQRVRKRPLCSLHAAAWIAKTPVGSLRFQAEKQALQAVANNHWDEYLEQFNTELAALVKALEKSVE